MKSPQAHALLKVMPPRQPSAQCSSEARAQRRLIAVGIDFGTANSAASLRFESGDISLLPLEGVAGSSADVDALFKSLLFFPTRLEAFFGAQAIEQYFERDREGRFFQSIKRLLPNPEFQGTTVHGKYVSLEELIARFLTEMKRRIELQIGQPIDELPVMMGRPARYSLDAERESLATARFQKACTQAGFKNYRLIDEPTAAALTYTSSLPKNEIVLVADLGGGTSDFTLMSVGSQQKTQVLSVHGIPVAGDSLDSIFFQHKINRYFGAEIRYKRPFSENILTLPSTFIKRLPKWHHHAFLKEKSIWEFLKNLHRELVDPRDKVYLDYLLTLIEDNLGYSLHQRVEELKVALSQNDRALFSFRSHPIEIEFEVLRSEYLAIIQPCIDAIAGTASETMKLAKVDASDIHSVYFTGGTSKVPAVREAVLALCPQARLVEKEAFTSVATGLAMAYSLD